jgi:hypothetical protein
MKKKIAIIGSSPIMLIIAKLLSKKNFVIIFEKDKYLGGAWKTKKTKSFFDLNLYSNVIVPLTHKDEFLFSKVNNLLSKLKVKIKKNNLRYEQNNKTNFKEIYEYDFSIFFKFFKKNYVIVKKEVKMIKLKNNKVIINAHKFDSVYLPYYSSIRKIIVDKKTINIPFKKIKSQHITLISKKFFLNDIFYVENFSEFFDRVQVLTKKNFRVFIARISKHYKHKKLSFLINKLFFLKKKDLIYKKKNSYSNYYRDKEQIKKIKNISNKNIIILDTTSFFESIRKYILFGGLKDV